MRELFSFRGRTRRTHYWVIVAIYCLVAWPGLSLKQDRLPPTWLLLSTGLAFYLWLAAIVRRIHDVGRSGKWFWLGPLGWFLIFGLIPGQKGENDYGPDPRRQTGGDPTGQGPAT